MEAMRNVTVVLDDETARWARIEAARRDISVSRLIRGMLEDNMRQHYAYDAAMQRYLATPGQDISGGERYPSREEVHDRAGLR